MLKNILVTSAILLSSVITFAASNIISDIKPNGTINRCLDSSDAGSRSYKLSFKEIANSSLVLQVDTFVCLRLEGVMKLVPYALADKQVFKNNGHVISYENIEASLAITNIDATALLTRINLDMTKFSQDVVLDAQVLRSHEFDVNLQFLEVIRLDGKVVDQGMRANGTYRVSVN